MSHTITIAGRRIGDGEPPYIIAEMSANHGGDFERARRIVQLAAEVGADAIKFQAYRAETMTLDSDMSDFVIAGDTPWSGRRLYELYQSAAMPYEWLEPLFAEARRVGIVPFCSPFDEGAVDLLERLDAPAYKIASFEAVDVGLIERCARTGKPLIISTGLASAEEIATALAAARAGGAREIALLKCTSAYPSGPANTNLMTIPQMARDFDVTVGLSDHTMGSSVPIAACAVGATIIEKHFIDAREPATADSTFSATPDELAAIVRGCRDAYEARGTVFYGPTEREVASLAFRRSLYVVEDIPAGGEITAENVKSIRPGRGLAPKHLPEVLGRRSRRALRRGMALSWDMLA